MSRRKRKIQQAKKENLFSKQATQGTQDWSQAEFILDKLLECNTTCKSGFCLTKHKDMEAEIEYLINNLPTLPYVMEQYLNFMFSNNLTTGNEETDEKILKPFLYKTNAKGVTNYSVIREAVKKRILYGKCGIRWLDEENGIVTVDSKQYTSLMRKDEEFYGFDRVVSYAVSTDENKPISLGEKPIQIDKDRFKETGQLVSKEKDILVVPTEDFVNLRTDVSEENGISCLTQDIQRLHLLANVYERLNYDIEYDGPGRLIFWLKDNFIDGGTIDISANQILDQTNGAKDLRAEKAKKEIKEMATEIKNSSSDNVILASSYFDKMEHIPRVTKATEFLEYLQMKEGSIIAQCIGMTPELLGLGDVSGNVSMEKIIDNAMMNTIIPMRETIATQFSPMLSKKLGVEKVYFNKYEAQYNIDKSSERYKDSLSVNQLTQALQASSEEGSRITPAMQAKMEEALSAILEHIIKQA